MLFTGIKPGYLDLKFVRAILNSPYPVLGYTALQQRAAVKRLQNQNPKLSDKQKWEFWQGVWTHGKSFEEKNLAIYFWSDPANYALAQKYHRKLLAWSRDLACWAHSDGLSSLYAKLLEDLGGPVDEILLKWNSSDLPWERRQSIVSLLYYARHRKKPPSARRVLTAIKALLDDDDYYVQKGVGWTLREIYQLHPKLSLDFIERHLDRIHPNAYAAAVEKLPLAKKTALRRRRASYRKDRKISQTS